MFINTNKWKLILDPRLTMANFWDKSTAVYGDQILAILEEPLEYRVMPLQKLTYENQYHFVNMGANVLRELGVKRGDRVVIATSNRIELITMCYSAFKLGAIAVPLNYMLKGAEIKYIVENCGAKLVFTDREVFDANIKTRDALPTIETWLMAGRREDCPEGFNSLDEMLDNVSEQCDPVKVHKHETIAIFYTSGTTGYPKGAMLTSKNLLTTQRMTAAVLPIGINDTGLSALPNAHLMGFAVALLCFMVGAKACYQKFFHPKKVLETMEKERATVFVGVPAMYAILLTADIENYDLSNMKLWGSGADAMPVEHIKKFVNLGRKSCIFFEAYGQVETSPITALKVSSRYWTFRHGCVGIPVIGVRIQIWDEEGRKLPRGESGELVLKGPNVSKGYWNDSEKNEESSRGGWFHTGDMAYRDKNGLLYFIDRKKDVIKAGGYSVFSNEVEEELRNHPKVAEVAVVGVPHPTKAEVVVAVVTLRPGETIDGDDILAWAKENIAEYKAPRHVEIRDEMPYGMTLKVLKRVLREEMVQKLEASKL